MKQPKHRKSETRLAKIRWMIGTPYFVQGTSTFTEIPILYFVKYVLGMGDAGGQFFDALRQTGWFVKPVWGLISDKVPLPNRNRYQWFRLILQTTLGFATIPAFIIPLTIAAETVNLQYAGVGYAFLMSLSNATNMFEGVVGTGLEDADSVERSR